MTDQDKISSGCWFHLFYLIAVNCTIFGRFYQIMWFLPRGQYRTIFIYAMKKILLDYYLSQLKSHLDLEF